MVKFIGLKIQGIRSIGDNPQSINFLTPLTIIQGPNGTGKTTIIEALNYITTGALPAGKMQTFIHNNQIANKPRVDALVQLVFTDLKGNTCTATKRMNASTARGGKLTTKSDEYTLNIVDKFGNPKSISSKVADFNKEMLNLLGVPKAVLEYVLFCHQEESNWPLSEPKELKMRFDAIFEVTKFVKALDNVKKNIKELNNQIQLIDKEMPHLENNLRARADLRVNYDQSVTNLKQNRSIKEKLTEEKTTLEKELGLTRKQIEKAVTANHEFEILQGKINTHMRYMEGLTDKEFAGTREDLVIAIENLKQSEGILEADNQRTTVIREIQGIASQIDERKRSEEYYRDQLMRYDSRMMVMRNREDEYMALLKQYSAKYEIPISPSFVDDLQAKITAIESAAASFIRQERERANVLAENIEKLRVKSVEHRSNSQSKRQEFYKLSQAIANAEKELKSTENASQTVGKLALEIQKWQKQLESMGDFKLLDEIWESLQSLQSELNTLRMDMMDLAATESVDSVKENSAAILEKANGKLDKALEHIGVLKRRVQISNQLNEFKDRKAVAGEKMVQQESLKQNLAEKKEQLEEVEKLLATASHELPVIEKELKGLEAERKEIVEAINARERESSLDVDSIKYAITKINELKAANERDKQANESSEDFRAKMEEQKAEVERLMEYRRQLENQLSGVENKKHELRLLEEQLRRMDIQKEVNILKRKLEKAREDASCQGVENIVELRKKEQRQNQRAIDINSQIHHKNGEQLQLSKKIDDLKKQLAEPRYEKAKEYFTDKLVERSITTAAIEDLEQYYKIVDDAIINFHQQKMEQINQILRDLWTRVYQGNDIETIKIKSKPVSGAEKKKSYDYSVVMTVDQNDIDMRDRCSAGQKVLASILIRIALADVFAGSCRVLALDEPTTNLDMEKVENIGTMLKSLIEIHKPTPGSGFGARELYEADEADFEDTAGGDQDLSAMTSEIITPSQPGADDQRSLQLIVITHDRRLVEHLYLACRPDFIYGLSKDENGVSRIKAHKQFAAEFSN